MIALNKAIVIPNQIPGHIAQWSYSRYDKWRTCPRSAYYKFIAKLAEPGSAAMDRGTAIHKLAEDYVAKRTAKFPKELKLLAPVYKEMRKHDYHTELELAFLPNGKKVTWFDKSPGLFRAKIDVVSDDFSHIADTKTGKNRGGYDEQMETYALAAYLYDNALTKTNTELLFVDTGERVGASFTNAEMKKLPVKWGKKVKPMFEDQKFVPAENSKCRFCHYRKSNGGPCPADA